MKTVSKLLLLLLMLGLLGAAIILPKFVQRSQETATSSEDLAALLVENAKANPKPEAFDRTLPKYESFYGELGTNDLKGAEKELMALRSEVDDTTFAALQKDLEKELRKQAKPTVAAKQPEKKAESPTAPKAKPPVARPSVDLVPFFNAVQSGDFGKADQFLGKNEENLSADLRSSLEANLANARSMKEQLQASSQKLAANTKELESSRAQLSESRKQVNELQSNSVSKLDESVKELASATAAAKEAAKEASQLRKEIAEMKKINADTPPVKAVSPAPAKPKVKPLAASAIPASVSIPFGFDSSYLTAEQAENLKSVAGKLKAEPRLQVQLRGFTDKTGPPEYNAMLSKARSEMVKDKLEEYGVEAKQIEILAFGESQATANNPAANRRVEVKYRSQ